MRCQLESAQFRAHKIGSWLGQANVVLYLINSQNVGECLKDREQYSPVCWMSVASVRQEDEVWLLLRDVVDHNLQVLLALM